MFHIHQENVTAVGFYKRMIGDTEGKTLFERWVGKKDTPQRADSHFFNPLDVFVGGFVSLSDMEVSGDFEVTAVAEYDRAGVDKLFRALISQGERSFIFEVDVEEADGAVRTYLFNNVDEFGFDEEFLHMLSNEEIEDNDGIRYQNVILGGEPVHAEVTVVTDPGGRPDKRRLSLWAFEREAPEGAQYLHVEMDEADGYFLIQAGREVIRSAVRVLPPPKTQ